MIKTWKSRMQELGAIWRSSDDVQEICKDAEIADLRAALAAANHRAWCAEVNEEGARELLAENQRAASKDSERDAARLDYVLSNGAFIVTVGVTHKSRYQLWNQDEDENHTVLSGPGDYATPREAIDAAMAAQQGEKD